MLIVITFLVGCHHSNLSHRWSWPDRGVCVCLAKGRQRDSGVHKVTVEQLRTCLCPFYTPWCSSCISTSNLFVLSSRCTPCWPSGLLSPQLLPPLTSVIIHMQVAHGQSAWFLFPPCQPKALLFSTFSAQLCVSVSVCMGVCQQVKGLWLGAVPVIHAMQNQPVKETRQTLNDGLQEESNES